MGGPNIFPDLPNRTYDEHSRIRATATHMVGQLALTGLEDVRQPSNEEVINSAVNDGSIERAEADSVLAALAALDARATIRRME